MTLTLDEWADKKVAFLRENLRTSIEVYCDEMPK